MRHRCRRLTLPSSELAPAGSFRPSFHSGPYAARRREPLMSNVRPSYMNSTAASCYAARASLRSSFHVATRVLHPPLGLVSRSARAVRSLAAGAPLALCCKRANPSLARSVPLVKRGNKNRAFARALCFMQEKMPPTVLRKVSRSCSRRCPSTGAVRHAVSQAVPLQRSWCRQPRPNPSVEGMAKRLRLLSTPHLER